MSGSTERDFAKMASTHAIVAVAVGRRGDMRLLRNVAFLARADFLDQTRRGENVLEFKAA